MTLPIGNPDRRLRSTAAFTLIELILVMALLVIVISLALPSLQRFFQARDLDSEAGRLLALTRFGRSQAISEGTPMDLWLDPQQERYGLQAATTYSPEDQRARQYSVARDIDLRVHPASPGTLGQSGGFSASEPGLPAIRFQPDGMLGPQSPHAIELIEHDRESLWLILNSNLLTYEIRTSAAY